MPVDLTVPTFPLPPVVAEIYTHMENMKVAVQAQIEVNRTILVTTTTNTDLE